MAQTSVLTDEKGWSDDITGTPLWADSSVTPRQEHTSKPVAVQ